MSLEDIEVEADANTTLKQMEGTYENLDFKYGIIFDQRNQTYQPTDGYISKFNQILPVIADKSSIMNQFTVTGYHGYSEDVIGTIKLFARSVHGLDNEDTRLTERLFIPASKLRGFNTKKVGPKDGKDYIGGNFNTALGLEAQLPNLLPEATKTDVSIFLDTANVWGVDYDDNLDQSKIRSSVGVSANVYTVIGPLTFILAQDITKASSDETQSFEFRLGTSF